MKKSDVTIIFEYHLQLSAIMTTGSAGGMAKPYKGMLPASAGTRPEYD